MPSTISDMAIDRKSKAFLKQLGQKARALRQDRGWSLEQTEDYGWTNWRHLQKIEGGKNITVVTLRKLAELYGVEPFELLKP